jgi:prophage antirepressor-like protein
MSHCNLSLAAPGGVTPAFKYISSSPAKPGGSGLIALPYNSFGVIRAYRDRDGFAWFVLSDVYKMLGIPGGTTGARNRLKRDPLDLSTVRLWVPNTVNPQASGYRAVQTVREGGLHAMLGASPLTNRADMRRWMTTTAVPILRSL